MTCTGYRSVNLGHAKALGSLGDEGEIRVFLDLERLAQKAQLVLQIDILLQGIEIGQCLGIAVIVFIGKDPVLEKFRLLLCRVGNDPDGLLMIPSYRKFYNLNQYLTK